MNQIKNRPLRMKRWLAFSVLLVAAGAGSVTVNGCSSGMCLLKICDQDGNNCRCDWHTCPAGSDFDIDRNECVCKPGLVSFNSACMTQQQANQFCGVAARYENGGCVNITCGAGEELDLTTGKCLAKQQMGEVAQNMGIDLGSDEKLGCPPGLVLVIENSRTASCVPVEQSCSPSEVWNGQACVKAVRCAPGTIHNPATGACDPITTGNEKTYTIDLQTWTWTTYGPPSGPGTPAFCSSFNKKPGTFAVAPGSSITVSINVTVQVANKQPSSATVVTKAVLAYTSRPVTSGGATLIQQAAQGLLVSLQAQTGTVSTNSVQTNVQCKIVNAVKPGPVPEFGGF